jgi:hypothetical protein
MHQRSSDRCICDRQPQLPFIGAGALEVCDLQQQSLPPSPWLHAKTIGFSPGHHRNMHAQVADKGGNLKLKFHKEKKNKKRSVQNKKGVASDEHIFHSTWHCFNI